MENTLLYMISLIVVTFLGACGVVANGRGARTLWSTIGQVLYAGIFLTGLYAFYCF